MKIVYYTSGITGAGRLVRGISIGNALARSDIKCDYVLVSSSSFGRLARRFKHIHIIPDDIKNISKNNYKTSNIFTAMKDLQPDILLVDLLWFPLHHFIQELPCKKIFLCRQVDEKYFSIPTEQDKLIFDKDQYDELLMIEPFSLSIEMKRINPLVIRNPDEIYTRAKACERLGFKEEQALCCIAYSGHPGDFERVRKDYSYLEEEYTVFSTSTYHKGIFPVVDYFNAIDFLVCGAGYNAFWEAVYFHKQAVFVPTHTRFESQSFRIRNCRNYEFTENGADQLVNLLAKRWG